MMVLFYYRIGMKQMETSTEKTAMSSSHPTRREEPEHAHLDRCQMLPASHAEGGWGGEAMMSAGREQERVPQVMGGEV
jgi:hypothetical protein